MIGFNRIISSWRLIVAASLISLAGACTQSSIPKKPPSPADEPKAPVQQTPQASPGKLTPESDLPKEELSSAMLFQVLLGEIAGQRGRLDVSGASYLEAARQTDDPRIAERALKISIYAKQQEPAYQAARRWVELAPDNLEARQALAALALRVGKDKEAIEQFEYILEHNEGAQDPYQSMLVLLAREPDKNRALGVMDDMVALRPRDAQAHFAYARLAVHAEKWTLAESEVGRSLQLKPDWVSALILRAQVQLKQGKGDLARSQMEAALSTDPKNTELRIAYARLLVDLDDYEEARIQYRKILKQQPDNGKVAYSLALLAMEAGQLDEAEDLLEKQLELEYQPQQAYYYLGAIAEEQGNDKQALNWYQKIEEGDNWVEVQIRMAAIQARNGNVDAARQRLRQIRMKQPQQTQRLFLVEGELLTGAGRYEDAFKLYSHYLESQPDDIEILYARSLIAEQINRIDVAESDLLKVLKQDPDNTRALNALGYTLADRTDRHEEALVYIQQAYKKTPDDPAVIDSMGWVLYKLGRLPEARSKLQKAYDMTSDSEIAAHLGEVMWAMGNREAAMSLWNKARKDEPDNKVLKETMQRLTRQR